MTHRPFNWRWNSGNFHMRIWGHIHTLEITRHSICKELRLKVRHLWCKLKTGSKYSQVDLPDFLVVHVWQKENILYCLCSPPDHSFAGYRKVDVFVLKLPLSAVFFLAFRCFGEYFPSETVSWCFLVYLFSVRVQVPSVYSGRSRQMFLSSFLDVELYHGNFCNKT